MQSFSLKITLEKVKISLIAEKVKAEFPAYVISLIAVKFPI
jgi:hypothetical protein